MSRQVPTVKPPSSAARRRRGRPRQFDYDQALDAALHTFWQRGFGGTSLDQLTAAMRLNRPSLYAAYGNKDATFAAALDRYLTTVGGAYLAALARPAGLRDALTAFFEAIIAVVVGAHGPTGCAIVCTLPAEAGASPAARRRLARAVADIDAAVTARLRQARAAGELAAGADPRILAQLVTGTMFALAIRARAGAPRAELRRIARALVTLIAG